MPVDNSAGMSGYIYVYADTQTSRRDIQVLGQPYCGISVGEKIRGVYHVELSAFVQF